MTETKSLQQILQDHDACYPDEPNFHKILEAVKEWLKERKQEMVKDRPYGTWSSRGIDKLLEELTE